MESAAESKMYSLQRAKTPHKQQNSGKLKLQDKELATTKFGVTYASLVSYFAYGVTNSGVFEGYFCLVIFSRFSRFSSATQHLKTRIKDLSTSNQTDSTVCSYLHSLGGASWVSGSKFTTVMSATTGIPCGL